MDSFNLTFTAFIGILGVVAWFFFQRQVKNADKEQNDKDAETRGKFHEQGIRIGALEKECNELRLELAVKVGREELDKLYEFVNVLRKDFKEDLKDLKNDLIAVIREK